MQKVETWSNKQYKCSKGLEKLNISTQGRLLGHHSSWTQCIAVPNSLWNGLQAQIYSHFSNEQTYVQHSRHFHIFTHNPDMPIISSWQQQKLLNAAVFTPNPAICSSSAFSRGNQLQHVWSPLQPSSSQESSASDYTADSNSHPLSNSSLLFWAY